MDLASKNPEHQVFSLLSYLDDKEDIFDGIEEISLVSNRSIKVFVANC